MKCAVLIPSFCPNQKIVTLIRALLPMDFAAILIVNDGSGDAYSHAFAELEQLGCAVVHHTTNRGKGAALKTGISELIRRIPNLDAIVTADGDGQHAPQDIWAVSEFSLENPESLILGTRDFSGDQVPTKSRFGNRFSSLYFRLSTHLACPDTQTGLRGIPSSLFALARSVPGDRYEYEMAFLMMAAKIKTPIQCTPIRTIYENNNADSHFRPVADALRIYQTPLKFLIASLLCAVLDLGFFSVFSSISLQSIWLRIFFATTTARLLSGTANFYLNRVWSFESSHPVGVQAVKYATLFLCQMLLSWLLVAFLSAWLPLPLTGIKLLTDSFLFVFSYFIQQNWVFAIHIKKKDRLLK